MFPNTKRTSTESDSAAQPAMKESDDGPPNRELYACLHLSRNATDEQIGRAYRHLARVFHPDRCQSPESKEFATQNFRRICEAYEILSDEHKRQIYDIYGMEGLTSGLELGPKLSKADEIKEEIERLLCRKKEERTAAHLRSSGTILVYLSLPDLVAGESLLKEMGMSSELQSQFSKSSELAIGGNMAVNGNVGGGGAAAVFKHQLSPVSSIELIGGVGLQALLGVRASRQLTAHSTATMGLAMSLRDGSISLTNAWTRRLSETSDGNFQLLLGPESSISVGWQRKDAKISAAGEVKFDTSSFGAYGHYTRRFSSKSHGRIAGKIGSHALEIDIGGGRKLSEFSTLRMLYSVGIQGIFWKFELHRGGQKLVVPVLLSTQFSPIFATGAFVIPTSLYFLLKNFVAKSYYLRRERKEARENMERTAAQVKEARIAAERAQQLLENVANRKRKKQSETGGLVITNGLYGNSIVLRRNDRRQTNDDVASRVLDVTLPLNFLVSDSGELKLHEGVKKSGIMGFCDPCPGEPKSLHVDYMYVGNRYEVDVDNYKALHRPNEDHRI